MNECTVPALDLARDARGPGRARSFIRRRTLVACIHPLVAGRALLLALLLILLSACSAGPTATPEPTQLLVAGSTSMRPALQEMAAAFQAANPNFLIEVQRGDTANGWEALRGGRADVAALSYWDETQPAPQGYRLIPMARDAVAVIVHPSNPISNVTALQLRALFGGEILDWAALAGTTVGGAAPGEDEPVIVSREDGSGTRTVFEARVMGDRRVTLNAIVMPTTQAVVDYVAGHRLAVAYMTLDAVDDRVRVVPVEGLSPAKNGATSGYYLTRILYLAARAPGSAAVRAFLEFAQGETGQQIWSTHYLGLR